MYAKLRTTPRDLILPVPLTGRPGAKARGLPPSVPAVRLSLGITVISRTCWRSGWDSNPRYAFSYRFEFSKCFQHLSLGEPCAKRAICNGLLRARKRYCRQVEERNRLRPPPARTRVISIPGLGWWEAAQGASPASRFWRPARISLTPPQRALGARPASCDRPRPSSPRTDGRPRRDRGRLTGAVRPADINSAPP